MVAHTDWDAAADDLRSKASKKSKDSASTAKSRNKRHMAALKKKAERKVSGWGVMLQRCNDFLYYFIS